MLQCSGRVYSPESWTLDDWQLSFMTTEDTEILLIKNMTLISVLIWTLLCCCFTGKVQRIKLLSSMNIRPSEMKPTKPWRCFLFLSVYPQSPEARSQWLSLQQWHLLWEAPQPSAVGPVRVFMVGTTYTGTNREMEKLLNSSFIILTAEHQEHQIVLQAVDQTLTSLWPSVEFRLKMQQFITVRVFTTSTVSMCSHSEKQSYKNLPQSDWTETEVTVAAGSCCRDSHTSLNTHTFNL